MYSTHLVLFQKVQYFSYQWKKLETNFKKNQQKKKKKKSQMANKFPWQSVTYIVHPRKEERQDRFHPLLWVSSNTEPTQGWREKATFKKEDVIKWGFYSTPS